tara:strand:+ start:2354 stop:4792 length:2439 start_codon:yes stop_codon:yes gene_type:complete
MTKTHLLFTTKVNTLKFLQNKLSKSKIEPLLDFTILEWTQNSNKILDSIFNKFTNQKIIIRSSAKGEDSFDNSHAGSYLSILNIDSNKKNEIKSAINSVNQSYLKKNNLEQKNQIFVQKQSVNIKISGVIFTKAGNMGLPYYLINYDLGSSTTSVTSGKETKTLVIFRKKKLNGLPKYWKNLVKAIKEIELIVKSDQLDIEFGINQNDQIIIFQVRPITFIETLPMINSEKLIDKKILRYKNQFNNIKFPKNTIGKKIIFSDMADWNPSEIIGNNPNLLDYSLYDFLIMEEIWHKSRSELGYQNLESYPLMAIFGNKPYVDLRASFNSLLPNDIESKIKKKLMNYYFKKLEKKPFLHDKVEFDILFTCYDLNIDSRLNELYDYNFTSNEIKILKQQLLFLTNEIIKSFLKTSQKCDTSINKLIKNRKKILSKSDNNKNYHTLISISKELLDDCKQFGTLPFAIMARISFIANIIFRSLSDFGYINPNFFYKIMNSINTPATELQKDLYDYKNNNISKAVLMKKYGHLRPGTYDVLGIRYDQQDNFFNSMQFSKPKKKSKIKFDKKIDTILKNQGLNFDDIDFLNFFQESHAKRETLKFEFSKNLSDAIELIVRALDNLGFSREDISNLDINTIFDSLEEKNINKIKSKFNKKIIIQKKLKQINDNFILPPIIFSKENFDLIEYYSSKPNFITNKKITSNIIHIKNLDKLNLNLKNKIVLLQNADPGFDWIFTQNPSGLITEYGGVASHMAIRCAELGLPASIGCGQLIFQKLIDSSKVLLDCENKQIIILKSSKIDEYIEVKKTLRSLGYIK